MQVLFLSLFLGCPPSSDKEESGGVDTGPWTPTVSQDRLMEHVSILASEAYQGRMAGSEGGEMAAGYVEGVLSGLGLEPAGQDGTYRLPFQLTVFEELAPAQVEWDQQALAELEDYELFMGSGSGDVTAQVVFAGYGLTVPPFDPAAYPDCPLGSGGYDDYTGLDVTDAIVLLFRHGPQDNDDIQNHCPGNEAAQGDADLFTFGYKAANAALHGASALLLVNDYREDGEHGQGSIGSSYMDPTFPALFLDRDIVEASLPDLPAWQDSLDLLVPAGRPTGVEAHISTTTSLTEKTAENVQAVMPGTDPDLADQVVVVGAHFDHLGMSPTGEVYAGADDNASGTAIVLEVATALVESGLQPRRTLVFCGFNGEEEGLLGSWAYTQDPPFPLEDTVAMLDLDMVGGGDDMGLLVFGATAEVNAWIYDLLVATSTFGDLSLIHI